jgi:phosphoglycerol transferase MdoB-like AlkP superfamily enzyme
VNLKIGKKGLVIVFPILLSLTTKLLYLIFGIPLMMVSENFRNLVQVAICYKFYIIIAYLVFLLFYYIFVVKYIGDILINIFDRKRQGILRILKKP